MADSKAHLQSIMNYASDFFRFTDIQLNLKKCELLVINKPYDERNDQIRIGKNHEDILQRRPMNSIWGYILNNDRMAK
jgi:hypothetical protein